jgi:hypothetical protein
MSTQPDTADLVRFEVATSPDPRLLGRALEQNARVRDAVLRLRFGTMTAGLPVSDLWSACCELLLQAELMREGRLDHFVLDVEHVFDVACAGEVAWCRFSPEHLFAVSRGEFAASLERAVDQIFAGTSCPALMHIAARWGAAAIRAQPYSHRFSESLLM